MHARLRHLFGQVVAGSVAVALWVTIGMTARADLITYTFTGVGNGTVDSTPWSGDFTFTFTGDTGNVMPGGTTPPIEYFQRNIGGTFSDSTFSSTLLANNTLVDNNDPNFPRVGFFNSTFDNGGTIQDPSLATYQLATAFGPITGTGVNLLPTLNGSGNGFGTTDSHTVELLGITSLTFSASVQAVPEPSSLALFAIGALAVVGFSRPWRKTAAV